MVIPNVATSVGSELVAYGLLAVYIHSGRLRYGLLTIFLFLVGSLYWTRARCRGKCIGIRRGTVSMG